MFKCQPPVLAITLYRPPKYCPTFFTDLSELLSIDLENYDKIIVLGDFNMYVYKETTSKAIAFMDLLSSMDFIKHVTGSTHNHGHTLDLVFTNGLSIDISSIVNVTVSDHDCVFFQRCCP
jgi:endonuclease/exonuclease/phosphatase (EEP) superfamily protein YafD